MLASIKKTLVLIVLLIPLLFTRDISGLIKQAPLQIIKENEITTDVIITENNKLLAKPGDSHVSLHTIPPGIGVPAEVSIPFKEMVESTGFSVFFPGNLHQASSFMPKDFVVLYLDSNDKWVRADEITNNKQNFYRLKMSPELVKAYKILIYDTYYFNIAQIQDLKIYTSGGTENVAHHFLSLLHRTPISYFLYTIFILLLITIPGIEIINILQKFLKNEMSISDEYKLGLSPFISIIIIAFLVSIKYIFNVPEVLYMFLILYIVSAFLFVINRSWEIIYSARLLVSTLFAAIFVSSLLQINRDFIFSLNYIEKYYDTLKFIPFEGSYFGYHADNLNPWGASRAILHNIPILSDETSQFILGRDPKEIIDRTPLFPILSSFFLWLYGEGHFIYMRYSTALIGLYYMGAYLVIRNSNNKQVSITTIIMLLLSVNVLFFSFNFEIYNKLFALYPLFLAMCLLNNKEKIYNDILIGVLLSIAFLVHPMTLIFSASMALYYLKEYRININSIIKTLKAFGFTFIAIVGWYVLTSNLKKSTTADMDGNFFVERLMVLNISSVFYRVINTIAIFFPDPLFRKDAPIGGFLEFRLIEFLRYSIISAMTPVLFFVFANALLIKKNYKSYLIWFGAIPLILFILVLPEYTLGNFYLLYPFVLPFLLAYTVKVIEKYSYKAKIGVLISYPVFMLLPLYFLSGVFRTIDSFSFTVGISKLLAVLSFLVLSILLIWVNLEKKNRIEFKEYIFSIVSSHHD